MHNLPSLKFMLGIGSKYEKRLLSSRAPVEAGPSICGIPSIGPNFMLNECLLVGIEFPEVSEF